MADDELTSLTARAHAMTETLRLELAMLEALAKVHDEQKGELELDTLLADKLDAYSKHLFEARNIGHEIISYVKRTY